MYFFQYTVRNTAASSRCLLSTITFGYVVFIIHIQLLWLTLIAWWCKCVHRLYNCSVLLHLSATKHECPYYYGTNEGLFHSSGYQKWSLHIPFAKWKDDIIWQMGTKINHVKTLSTLSPINWKIIKSFNWEGKIKKKERNNVDNVVTYRERKKQKLKWILINVGSPQLVESFKVLKTLLLFAAS